MLSLPEQTLNAHWPLLSVVCVVGLVAIFLISLCICFSHFLVLTFHISSSESVHVTQPVVIPLLSERYLNTVLLWNRREKDILLQFDRNPFMSKGWNDTPKAKKKVCIVTCSSCCSNCHRDPANL